MAPKVHGDYRLASRGLPADCPVATNLGRCHGRAPVRDSSQGTNLIRSPVADSARTHPEGPDGAQGGSQ